MDQNIPEMEEIPIEIACPLCGKNITVPCFQGVQISGRQIGVVQQGFTDLPDDCPDNCHREVQ